MNGFTKRLTSVLLALSLLGLTSGAAFAGPGGGSFGLSSGYFDLAGPGGGSFGLSSGYFDLAGPGGGSFGLTGPGSGYFS